MKIRYILAIGILMGASIARASLVAEWSADKDSTIDTSWVDSVGSKGLDFTNWAPKQEVRVAVTGQDQFDYAYSFGGQFTEPYKAGVLPAYFQDLSDISVSVWFNADLATQNGILFSTGGNAKGFSLLVNDNGSVRAIAKDGATTADAQINIAGADNAITAGNWYHLAFTFDSTAGKGSLYLNGTSLGSQTDGSVGDITGASATAIASTPGQLGGADSSAGGDTTDDVATYGRFFGDISLVQVYDTALSATEVVNLVPEPATMGLIALSGVVLLFVNRRFRQ